MNGSPAGPAGPFPFPFPALRSGAILIGDVAFESRAALEACRAAAGESWDGEEVYFVADELREALPGSRFEKLSSCAGILTLESA